MEGNIFFLQILSHSQCDDWNSYNHLATNQVMKMKVKAAQSCLTLGDAMDHTVHGIL